MGIKSIALAASALALSTSVNAAVISVDWQSAGDNLITRDTTSGLDWLDLTETTYMDYQTVFADQVAGGQFNGWRYATVDEVTTLLLSNFGIDLYDGNTTTGPLPAGLALATSYLGNTTSVFGSQYTGVSGITSQVHPTNDSYHLVIGADYNSDTSTFFRRIDPDLNTYFQNDRNVAASVGHWLVAATPWEPVSTVPVPAAVWLFGSGLLALIGVARRKVCV